MRLYLCLFGAEQSRFLGANTAKHWTRLPEEEKEKVKSTKKGGFEVEERWCAMRAAAEDDWRPPIGCSLEAALADWLLCWRIGAGLIGVKEEISLVPKKSGKWNLVSAVAALAAMFAFAAMKSKCLSAFHGNNDFIFGFGRRMESERKKNEMKS